MKKAFWWIVAIVIVVILIILGSQKGDSKDMGKNGMNDKGPIKIGFIGDFTKVVPTIGVSARAGVEVAVDEINAAGGINGRQVELIAEDGKCGSNAASAAQKLINIDKVFMIIGGGCSGETSAFVKTAMDAKIPVFSYISSAPDLSNSGKYFFRDYPSDAFQGKFAAEYLYNTLGARKVAVIHTISDWGNGIKTVFDKEFKALGGEVVLLEGVQQDAKDVRTTLSKVKSLNPDYIYMPMYADTTIAAVNQMKELGIKTKIFGADAWSDPKVYAEVGGKADLLFAEVKTGANDDLVKKIKAKTKMEQVPVGAAQAYDAMKLVALTLAQSGTNPDVFADTLRAQNYAGVSGQIQFDANGDLLKSSYIVKRIGVKTAEEVK